MTSLPLLLLVHLILKLLIHMLSLVILSAEDKWENLVGFVGCVGLFSISLSLSLSLYLSKQKHNFFPFVWTIFFLSLFSSPPPTCRVLIYTVYISEQKAQRSTFFLFIFFPLDACFLLDLFAVKSLISRKRINIRFGALVAWLLFICLIPFASVCFEHGSARRH